MAKKRRQQQQPKPEKESIEDWVNSLAQAAAETAGTSKEERIQRRAAKKRRREERKKSSVVSSQQKQEASSKDRHQRPPLEKMHSLKTKEVLHVSSIADEMKEYVSSYVESHGSRLGKIYESNSAANKARNKKRTLDEESIQPRKRDYSGIGLARPSLFLNLDDPAVLPKLEEEFAEHIPGFFGKQRTKAMKKQMAGRMLWRQLADKKNSDEKIHGKKLSEMTPDERVEAMIKAGMVYG